MLEKKKIKFPVNVLPEPARKYFQNLEEYSNFSMEYLAGSFLAMCSIYIGNKNKVRYSESFSTGVPLWVTIVGSSSTMKTPAIKKAFEPLMDLEVKNHELYKKELESYNPEVHKNKPKEKQLVIDDFTIESLYKILSFNPNGLIIKRDELDGLLAETGRYNSGGQEQKLLSLYSGVPSRVNRKKDNESFMTECGFLSMIGGIQTEILPNLLNQERMNNGFIGRILFVVDQEDKLSPPKRGGDETLRNSYKEFCETLESIPEPDYPNIPEIDLSWEAYDFFYSWLENTLYGEYINGPYSSVAVAYFKKLEASTLKFALIMEILHREDKGKLLNEVGLEAMKKAIQITEYFIDTFLFTLGKVVDVEKDETNLQVVVNYVKSLNNSKSILKPIAMDLRKKGMSIERIAKTLQSSKSTIHDYIS